MPDVPYQMIIRCSGHQDLPRERVQFRSTATEAIEGAKRWLRLYRNTDEKRKAYDRWAVYDLTFGRANRRLVDEGGIDGHTATVSGGGVFPG